MSTGNCRTSACSETAGPSRIMPSSEQPRADEISACSSETRSKALLDVAYHSWKAGVYTDVTLLVGKERFPAHRLVLASLSDYFPPLFKLDENESGEVTLHNVEPEDFSVLLNFAYTGEVAITKDNVQNVLIAADYFSVTHVKNECVRFMASNLDSDNVCDILIFADHYNLVKLKSSGEIFLRENLEDVSKTVSFSQLDPRFLAQFFDDDGLVLSLNGVTLKSEAREKMILDSVLRYLSGLPEQNPELIEMMIRIVRLTVLPKGVMKECVKNHKVLKDTAIIRKYVKLKELADKYLHECSQGYLLATVKDKGAEEVPDKWFQHRKLIESISVGPRRYAAGGEVGRCPHPPESPHSNPALQIKRIDFWIGRWAGHTVIRGLSIEYRDPVRTKGIDKYSKGECTGRGDHFFMELEPHEVITKVIIGSGHLIDRLGFETNRNRRLGPFGGPDGGEYKEVAPTNSSAHLQSHFGCLSYLLDINCDDVLVHGGPAIFNLMLRWISFE